MKVLPAERLDGCSWPTPVVLQTPGRRLGVRQRVRLAGEIVVSYAHARRVLRGAPIVTALSALRAQTVAEARPADAASRLEEARQLGNAVSRTLSLLPGDTRCLTRSLVLTRLLARRGMSAKVVIGTRSSPEFLAHAWVEYDGEPVLSPGDGSFGRLAEL